MGNEAMDMNQSQSSQPSKPSLPVDAQAIIERAKDILTNPKGALEKIASQKISTADLLMSYLMPLAAVAFLSQWLGWYFVGVMTFFGGLVFTAAQIAGTLAALYLSAVAVEKLLPKFFQAQASSNDAMKLFAFAFTPAAVGGVFGLVPALNIISVIFGVYSLYLLYLGIPKLLNISTEKHLPVFGAILVSSILIGFVVFKVIYFVLFNILGLGVYKFDPTAIQNEILEQLQKFTPPTP